MKSTAKAAKHEEHGKKVVKQRKPAKVGAVRLSRVVVLDGVRVQLPPLPGKPKRHTEEQIRAAVRDFYAARKA